MSFGLRLGEHRGIHGGELVSLARDGGLQVVAGGGYAVHGSEVALRMNHLRLGGGTKQAGDVRQTVLLRLAGKRPIFLVGLALAGESFVQIRASAHNDSVYQAPISAISRTIDALFGVV